jgi:hypothetical protein
MTYAPPAPRAHNWTNQVTLLLIIFVDGLGTAIMLPMMPTLLSADTPNGLVHMKHCRNPRSSMVWSWPATRSP